MDPQRSSPWICATALGLVIAVGLLVDQLLVSGQLWANILVWAVYFAVLRAADRQGRALMVWCVLIATAGECFLSLVWGLYDYRLGNVPLFVPPGHALLLLMGLAVAARVGTWVTWLVPLVAAPAVAGLAVAGRDTLGVVLFAVLLLALAFGRARKLYAVMFALSLLLELYGTWLGNWRWSATVPWLHLSTCNPPLAAGAFYCLLDVLVMAAMRAGALSPQSAPERRVLPVGEPAAKETTQRGQMASFRG